MKFQNVFNLAPDGVESGVLYSRNPYDFLSETHYRLQSVKMSLSRRLPFIPNGFIRSPVRV